MMRKIFAVFLLNIVNGWAQRPVDCNRAPREFWEICRQLRQFDVQAREDITLQRSRPHPVINAPSVPFQPELSPAVPTQAAFNPSVYDCMDMQCLCPYFQGGVSPSGVCYLRSGVPLQRTQRKELRMLSENERTRFYNAVQQLKLSGEYDRMARIHRAEASGSGAHSGPSFLPWHREFLKRMELALRLIDPSVSIPYWDSVLDSYLPDPRQSILWSRLFAGDTDSAGRVIDGPFVGFRTIEGNPAVVRKLGTGGHLFTEQNLNQIYSKNTILSILAYTAPTQACPYPPNFSALEYYHGSVHLWVGGDMKPPRTSANDMIFFFHHSFVDYIFEQWRQMHQNRFQREHDFPEQNPSCTTPLHYPGANMRPFNFINIDGLSNAYTDNMYTYAPRPTCTSQEPLCRSQFLFCDVRRGRPHCVSKIKLGGRCTGFEGQDACYMGICVGGVCRSGSFAGTPAPTVATTVHNRAQPVTREPAAQAIPPRTTPPPVVTRTQTLGSVVAVARTRAPQAPQVTQKRRGSSRRWNTMSNVSVTRRPSSSTSRLMNAVDVPNCFNDDPCCSFWANDNECTRSTAYMSQYCRRSCGYCRSRDRMGCFDRHTSCAYLRSQGECSRRRQWMAENCQWSCGWCHISKISLCTQVARMSRM